eukprot:1567966-Rhodomonas_salina.3
MAGSALSHLTLGLLLAQHTRVVHTETVMDSSVLISIFKQMTCSTFFLGLELIVFLVVGSHESPLEYLLTHSQSLHAILACPRRGSWRLRSLSPI